jgi:hypothetical protein
MKNKHAQALGRKGGAVKSEKKRAAAIANSKRAMQLTAEKYFKEFPQLYDFQKEIIERIRTGERFLYLSGRRFGLKTLASVLQLEQKVSVPVESKNQLHFDHSPDNQNSDMSCSDK